MLESLSPGVVHVITPAPTHKQIAMDCLKAGSHVIVEKPMALSKADFDDMWKCALDYDRLLTEDQNWRFNRPVQSIDEMIAKGYLGEITDVEIRMVLNLQHISLNEAIFSRNMPCGIVHDFISHLVYLALHFVPGLQPNAVFWRSLNPNLKFDDLDALLTAGSARARIRFTTQTWPESFTLSIRGTAGSAEAELFQPHISTKRPRVFGKQLTPVCNQFINGAQMVKDSFCNFRDKIMQKTTLEGIHTFLQHTYTALIDGSEVPVSYNDMAKTLELIDEMVNMGSII